MIINLRGTSGSGKSTIIRKVMQLYPHRMPFRLPRELPRRRMPVGYCCQRDGAPMGSVGLNRNLVVMGHYESPCGGCDTISGYDLTFDLIRRAHALGQDVLFEGLLLSGDVKRITELHGQVEDLRVIALDTPLDVCLASVNERRRVKNPDAEDVNPKTTTAKFKGVKNAVEKFIVSGMNVSWASRDEAFTLIKEWLEI